MKRTGVMCAAQLVGALIVFGLIGCAGDATKKTVTVDGSSTVFPVSEAAAEEFQKANRGIKVTVALSGTGGGFKKFGRGDIDISDASRPIMAKEIEECKKNDIDFIELPVCFDALTVVVNKENDFVDHLTVDELKMMWSKESKDKITKWSDIRKSWPKEKFILFGPGTDSGTFDYFTEAINGKAGNSRDDYTASEDDNVLVTGVAKNKYALGAEQGQAQGHPHPVVQGQGKGAGRTQQRGHYPGDLRTAVPAALHLRQQEGGDRPSGGEEVRRVLSGERRRPGPTQEVRAAPGEGL
jgi:phosphate binding protein